MSEQRRTVLADAAIDVLAESGMRGLTHRAVDRAAALPPGTTSAYFRTRAALLTALVRRLVARDQAELQTAGERPPPRTAADLIDCLAALATARLGPGEGRRRSLARYTCAVESTRDPELRAILVPRENAGRDTVRTFLTAHGVPDPEARTLTLLSCVDGLILNHLLTGTDVPRDALKGLVAAALRPGPANGTRAVVDTGRGPS